MTADEVRTSRSGCRGIRTIRGELLGPAHGSDHDIGPIDWQLVQSVYKDASLSSKTQMLFPSRAHDAATRGSHTLDVAGSARSIAENIKWLRPDIAYAIGLLHDIGHGPGGHSFERVASRLLGIDWDHAQAGGSCATKLGLPEILVDGISCHSWERPVPKSAEAELVGWVDRICYLTTDWADVVRIGARWVTTARQVLRLVGVNSFPALRAGSFASIRWVAENRGVIGMEDEWAIRLDRTYLYTLELLYASDLVVTANAVAERAIGEAIDRHGQSLQLSIEAVRRLKDDDLPLAVMAP